MKNTNNHFDLYETVTNRILEEMDKGIIPWKMSWIMKRGDYNPVSKSEYHGINIWLLNISKAKNSYKDNRWMTFLQIKEKGYHLKKDSESAFVVFWKLYKKDETDPEAKEYPVLRYYRVFNGDCIEGLPEEESKETTKEQLPIDKVIEEYISRENIALVYGKPAYHPAEDNISIPDRVDFTDNDEYYSALLHEIVHSTGAKNRLDRFTDDEQFHFASESYSKEELVAELGSSFVCAEYGLSGSFQNSVAYIQGWTKKFQDDKRLIIYAASQAEKAVHFFYGEKNQD